MNHADFLDGATTVVFDNVDRTHFDSSRKRIEEGGSIYFKKRRNFLCFEMDWSRQRSARTRDLVRDAGKGEATDLRAFPWMKEESEERQREELMMMERKIECRGIRNVYITFGSVVD